MSRRVMVLGAGVIGLCTAYYSALEGHEVVVVEREGEDHQGCSWGNAGLIVPSHIVPLAAPGMISRALRWMWNPESPFYVRPRMDLQFLDWAWKFYRAASARQAASAAPVIRDLNLHSRLLFEELDQRTAHALGLVKEGVLLLCRTQQGLDEEAATATHARQLGLEVNVLDDRETKSQEPGLQMNIVGAVHYLQDAHMDPARFMTALRTLASQAGVKFRWNSQVDKFVTTGRQLNAVVAEGLPLPADEFVLCGGSWSGAIASQLSLRLPLEAGKGYNLTLEQPPVSPRRGAILVEGRVAVTPMGKRLRFAGTMELAGLNLKINPSRLAGIRKTAMQFYPQFTESDFKGIEPWCGLRPCTPDGLPYLGRAARYDNLTIACGHAMMGLSLGPVTGRIVAQLISGRTPDLDLSLLNPDRYNT